MNFGKVEKAHLDNTLIHLPPDHERNHHILSGKPANQFTLKFGCSSWGLREWKGILYPKTAKTSDFLKHYSAFYQTVEFSPVFYALPTHQQVYKWKEQVGPHFRFCPKFPESITHQKKFIGISEELNNYLSVMYEFGDHLGPAFLMPHPSLRIEQFSLITQFLDQLPFDFASYLELRNASWFPMGNELFDALEKRKIPLVITDTVGRRDVVHMTLTQPKVMIRFVGNDLHPTDYARIDEWVQRLAFWINNGLEECYFFIHQHEERHSPELLHYFIQQLNPHLSTPIHHPNLLYQGGLFD